MKNTNTVLTLIQRPNTQDLRKTHLDLNRYYHTQIFGDAQAHWQAEQRRGELKRMETIWIGKDKQECIKKYNCDHPIQDDTAVIMALKNHSVCNHPLFDYLSTQADLNALKVFAYSESLLTFEYFDYLALSILGSTDLTKLEIIKNLWNEAGRGEAKRSHTNLFGYLLRDLGLSYKREQVVNSLPWEALAGINLFSYCSLYSYNKMMYFGLLAATELLDPPHYQKLIQGLRRLFAKHKMNFSYYLEHEAHDALPARGWLYKVILPELAKDPAKTRDFWLGFYLRLDSAKRYYDELLTQLTSQQAA